jgi:hypothetical protein
MKFIIDCESGVSALESVANGFKCSKSELESALIDFDVNYIFENDPPSCSCEELIANEIFSRLGKPKPIDAIMWFHCTRTIESNRFDDGLLPLKQSLSRVWDMLEYLAPSKVIQQNLVKMRTNGVDNDHYTSKVANSIDDGIYGFQVRELAISKNAGLHDYLSFAEIVEDILNGHKNEFGIDLLAHYKNELIPKIVKFVSTKNTELKELECALGYLYTFVRNEKPSSSSYGFISMEGEIVPPSDIVKIEEFPKSNDNGNYL